MINQGDIFWIDLDEPLGTEPAYRRPHAVVQSNAFDHSRINTVVVCPLTSSLKRASLPGNVILDPGESGLPKRSVVNVTQVFTVDKSELEEKIGTLSPKRVREVIAGIKLVLEPREID